MLTRTTLLGNIWRYGLLSLGALVMMLPFMYMISTSFKSHAFVLELPPRLIPTAPTLENYQRALTTNHFGLYFFNSTVVAVSATFVTVVLSAMLAYAFARWEFPGRNALFYAMLGTMMVPALTLIIPQFVLAKQLHLLFILLGIVLFFY
jgi:multiple sugar transport system permease protein